MTLKDKITDLCRERNISVRELENRAGLKQRTIQHWDKSEPSALKLYMVAYVLDVRMEELLSVYDPNLPVKEKAAPILESGKNADTIRLSELTDGQKKLIARILNYSDDQISAFLSITQSVPTNQ